MYNNNNNNNNNDEIWGEKYITNFMVSYFNKKINFVPFMSTNDNNLLSHKYNKNKNVNIKFSVSWHVSGIIFIRYAQNQNI